MPHSLGDEDYSSDEMFNHDASPAAPHPQDAKTYAKQSRHRRSKSMGSSTSTLQDDSVVLQSETWAISLLNRGDTISPDGVVDSDDDGVLSDSHEYLPTQHVFSSEDPIQRTSTKITTISTQTYHDLVRSHQHHHATASTPSKPIIIRLRRRSLPSRPIDSPPLSESSLDDSPSPVLYNGSSKPGLPAGDDGRFIHSGYQIPPYSPQQSPLKSVHKQSKDGDQSTGSKKLREGGAAYTTMPKQEEAELTYVSESPSPSPSPSNPSTPPSNSASSWQPASPFTRSPTHASTQSHTHNRNIRRQYPHIRPPTTSHQNLRQTYEHLDNHVFHPQVTSPTQASQLSLDWLYWHLDMEYLPSDRLLRYLVGMRLGNKPDGVWSMDWVVASLLWVNSLVVDGRVGFGDGGLGLGKREWDELIRLAEAVYILRSENDDLPYGRYQCSCSICQRNWVKVHLENGLGARAGMGNGMGVKV